MSQELIEQLRSEHSVSRVCQVLGVPRSSYYARCRRPEPARVREDRHLKQKILAVHAASGFVEVLKVDSSVLVGVDEAFIVLFDNL